MSKCAICLSNNVCRWYEGGMSKNLCCAEDFPCPEFKPKSRYIELPCAVGDTVYVIGNVTQKIHMLTVLGVWKTENYIQIITNQGLLLSEFYFTKEEAEKALERSEGK